MKKRQLSAEELQECAKLKAIFHAKKTNLAVTQQMLADEIGTTQGAISHYLNGRNALNLKVAVAFSKLLKEPVSKFSKRLAGEQASFTNFINETPEEYSNKLRKVPVISWVKAGKWCESPNSYVFEDADEWIDCHFPFSEDSFCLKVIGDSMSPDYREGEYILVDPTIEPLHNDDVIAQTQDNSYTFKRLQITPEGNYLLALNPDHPQRKIKIPENSSICGVVTGSWIKRR